MSLSDIASFLMPGSGQLLEGKTQLFISTHPTPEGMVCHVQPSSGFEVHTHFSIFCTSGKEVCIHIVISSLISLLLNIWGRVDIISYTNAFGKHGLSNIELGRILFLPAFVWVFSGYLWLTLYEHIERLRLLASVCKCVCQCVYVFILACAGMAFHAQCKKGLMIFFFTVI